MIVARLEASLQVCVKLTDVIVCDSVAMPKCATLPWIVAASATGFWQGLAAILPGGACLVSSCCEEEWGQSFSSIYDIVGAQHTSSYGITD
eukprot:1919038-Amphidinium_carterae.1